MPRGGPLIMDNFIFPALENETYGETLKWVNKDQLLFRLSLVHKNNSNWNANHVKVFTDWDVIKNRSANSKSYLTEAKQRFKNALRKCQSIKEASPDLLRGLGIEKDKNNLYYVYEKTWKKTSKGKKARRSSTKTNRGEDLQSEMNPITIMTPPPSPEIHHHGHLDVCNVNSRTSIDFNTIEEIVCSPFADNTDDPVQLGIESMDYQNQVVPSPSVDATGDFDFHDGIFLKDGDVMFSSSPEVIIETDILKFDDGNEGLEFSEILKNLNFTNI